MMSARLRLKNANGWFAAGQEVALVLETVSAEAFRLYLYLCLNADRQTGRMDWEPEQAAQLLRCTGEYLRAVMQELQQQQVCLSCGIEVEIADRFWPYEKRVILQPGSDLASYIQQVRRILLRPACVRAGFSPADERLAANFHRRGVTLTQLERAIWLGCARKYVTLLNGQTPMLITSLHYFTGIVSEVASTNVTDSYWLHVKRKAEQLERRWIAGRKNTQSANQDEMMETK